MLVQLLVVFFVLWQCFLQQIDTTHLGLSSYQTESRMLGLHEKNNYFVAYQMIWLEQHYLVLHQLVKAGSPFFFAVHLLNQLLVEQLDYL